MVAVAALASIGSPAKGAEDEHRVSDLIVTAPRQPEVLVLEHLTDLDVAGYGVNTIGEFLAGLSRELAPGSSQLVLVNGRRISSVSEVTDLPTEAIQRVEVLSEQAALRYGGSPGQKVVNIVLRPQFRSATASLAGGLATEGGGQSGESAVSLTRILGDDRLSLGARAFTTRRLLESQRDIQPTTFDMLANVSDLGRFRTLRPEQRGFSLNGTLARALSKDVKVSVNANGRYETSRALNGLAAATLLIPAGNPYSPFSTDVAMARYLGAPLEQRVRGVGGNLGLTVNADLDRWSLSTTAEYGHRRTRTRTDRAFDTGPLQARLTAGDPALNPFGPLPASVLGARLQDLARSRLGTGGLVFVASGPLLKAPAGDVRVSLQTELTRSSLTARLERPELVSTGARDRTDAGVWLNLEAPITRRSVIGDFSSHFSAAVRSVSDIRTLRSLGYGVGWTPRTGVNITASMKVDRQPPSLLQLASPTIETSGVRLFDFVSGETVELTRLSGGNPALLPDRRRTFKVGVNLLPLKADRLRISAEYARVRVRDPVADLPAATAEIQAAFPDRFIRDPDGALVRIDSRLINFASEDRHQLHWGFVFRRTPPARATNGPGPGLGLRLSLFHTWVFKDELLLRPGVAVVDRLHGGPTGGAGGQPRHALQWELAANRRGLGARLTGAWQSATVVRGGTDPTTELRFSSLAQHDLHLYADLGERFPNWKPGRGVRVSLTAVNLLNDRQKVRDGRGATPLIYQPAYLDPLGRTVTLGLRKQLF